MVTQTTAYIVTGTSVTNKVAKDGELDPEVAFRGDTLVLLLRADPTLGSLLEFCQ